MTILFISGVNDLSTVSVQADSSGNIYPVLDGNCAILGRVPLKTEIPGFMALFGKGVRQPVATLDKPPSLVVNQIADADTHRGALERCQELLQHVNAPVLNPPGEVLRTRRDEVSSALRGIPGVAMPRTIRVQPDSPEDVVRLAKEDGVAAPFIVRVAENFDGAGKVLVKDENALDGLDALPFDGRDYYVTEFIDCSDGSGISHAQRIAVIDGEPVLRRALFNAHWDVGGHSRKYMLGREKWGDDLTRTEWFESDIMPSLTGPIGEITRRLKLDYYSIDCSVRPDGEMVVFEAGPKPDALRFHLPQENGRMKRFHGKIQAMLANRSGEVVV